MSVRVRFAPSPTGFLHIGSARTALFNWLFARHHKGEFILRIEDTDRVRSNEKFLKEIMESLQWMGLNWDGEIEYQMKRLDIYREHAERLLKSGKAKKVDGTQGVKTDEGEVGSAIVFPLEARKVSFDDLLHGRIEVDTTQLGYDTVVLMKADGTPTYNFACVVDDATMGMTHIIRGDDHISNTPKQIVLYEALGYPIPQFAHIPLILGPDGGRLSKRHGATSIEEYHQRGFLGEALVNYLALLAWSPGNNQEIISLKEMIEKFDIADVNKTAATFDLQKLTWVNHQYIKQTPVEKLVQLMTEGGFLPENGKWKLENGEKQKAWLAQVVELLHDRLDTLADIKTVGGFFFAEKIEDDPAAVEQVLKEAKARSYFGDLAGRLEAVNNFEHDPIEQVMRDFCQEKNIKTKELFHPVRVAVTGRSVSPPLFQTMALLGKEKVVRSLKRWAA
ncbi:MAG: glutamate--tRNA ligase [Candidatus Omnitrophica bacterium]|nr:glutamate--tRNA ligase [Candidatus Omnitrophota bacterium]